METRDANKEFVRIVNLILAVFLAGLTCACGSSESKSSSDDDRDRTNESHITIHQSASTNSPVIGWAIENGTPSKGNLRTDARFLELTVLGNAFHPTSCAVFIEHVVSDQLDEEPGGDDQLLLGDDNPTTERSYTIPCAETADSTTITWPDGSIRLTGHIEEPVSSNEEDGSDQIDGDWTFEVDHIQATPRITKFEPKGSFTWDTPSPGQG